MPADNIVVVGHAETELKRTVEDPPFSGPVAGIGAGLDHVDADRLFVLSCDIPFIASGLPRLIDTYEGEGVCFGGEKAQHLAGLYSSDVLRNRIGLLQQGGGLIGMPVRKLMESLDVTILGEHEAARDPRHVGSGQRSTGTGFRRLKSHRQSYWADILNRCPPNNFVRQI